MRWLLVLLERRHARRVRAYNATHHRPAQPAAVTTRRSTNG